MKKIYLNLTNGIEAIPTIKYNYSFIRIQSTICEQKNWDRLIQELDYDFLMNLALGNECDVYDYGANKPIPRAMYQCIEFDGTATVYNDESCDIIINTNKIEIIDKINEIIDYINKKDSQC